MSTSSYLPVQEISLDGFQLVSGEMFRHFNNRYEATCTLWWNSITFSKLSVETLNNCERILLRVNVNEKRIIIVPCTSKDEDGIRWSKGTKDCVARKMDCQQFASKLFEAWGWNTDCVYRTSGKLVSSEKKVMLLFDFNSPESWKFKARER